MSRRRPQMLARSVLMGSARHGGAGGNVSVHDGVDDVIIGGRADAMFGGVGADIFRYLMTDDST